MQNFIIIQFLNCEKTVYETYSECLTYITGASSQNLKFSETAVCEMINNMYTLIKI